MKEKYWDSVLNTLEKSNRFEKLRYTHKDRFDPRRLIQEMSNICEKTAKENNIPFSALDEILKDSGIVKALLSLLKFGDQKNSQKVEEIPENKGKSNLGR